MPACCRHAACVVPLSDRAELELATPRGGFFLAAVGVAIAPCLRSWSGECSRVRGPGAEYYRRALLRVRWLRPFEGLHAFADSGRFEGLYAFADERRTAVNQSCIQLDRIGAGIQFFLGLLTRQNSADTDDARVGAHALTQTGNH